MKVVAHGRQVTYTEEKLEPERGGKVSFGKKQVVGRHGDQARCCEARQL